MGKNNQEGTKGDCLEERGWLLIRVGQYSTVEGKIWKEACAPFFFFIWILFRLFRMEGRGVSGCVSVSPNNSSTFFFLFNRLSYPPRRDYFILLWIKTFYSVTPDNGRRKLTLKLVFYNVSCNNIARFVNILKA